MNKKIQGPMDFPFKKLDEYLNAPQTEQPLERIATALEVIGERLDLIYRTMRNQG